MEAKIPAAFAFLYEPARYKALPGGRVSGKSWAIAHYLVTTAAERPRRILVGRQERTRTTQSIKPLLENTIDMLGYGKRGNGFFDCRRDDIVGANGSKFVYHGYGDRPDSLRGFEGFDCMWSDEAHELAQVTLDTMPPTLRVPGSEMIFSWNRMSIKDPVDNLFFGGRREDYPGFPADLELDWISKVAPADTLLNFTTYKNNPYLTDESRKEIEDTKRRDYNKYLNIYGGRPVISYDALVFPEWSEGDLDKEIDKDDRPYLGADFGFPSATCLIECYVLNRGGTLYFSNEAYRRECPIPEIPSLFAGSDVRMPKRWQNPKSNPGIASVKQGYPIIADTAAQDKIELLKSSGFKIKAARKGPGSLEEGLEFMKSMEIVVHPTRCPNLKDELAKYSYKTDKLTDEVLPVLQDKHNHLIDAARYALESVRRKRGVHISYGAGMAY